MNPVTIGIIGGTGGMGRLFRELFEKAGHRVLIAGRQTELSYLELTRKSDIVILSTPVDAAIQICEIIGPIMTEDQALMDFCSLKEDIVAAMLKGTTKAEVVGTHPLSFSVREEAINGGAGSRGSSTKWARRLRTWRPIFTIETWRWSRGSPIC
jgi:prephenate dehydrogenase